MTQKIGGMELVLLMFFRVFAIFSVPLLCWSAVVQLPLLLSYGRIRFCC
jgi:hypothetical protein